jgi:hypothetical protein
MSTEASLQVLLESLSGQPTAPNIQLPRMAVEALDSGKGLGYSQLNELLLILGYDRICPELFQFLIDGTTEYSPGSSIRSILELQGAVTRFRKLALLFFGNVKFAFKRLGTNPDELLSWVQALEPRDEQSYEARHDPIQPVELIDPADTYLLGYVIEAELKRRLDANSTDAEALALLERRKGIVERGRRNHSAYLVSDHLDVYVATSMRERHEFLIVSDLCAAIFSRGELSKLKLRWFDPTQAYCSDRIDKGLAEALMLKRAKCTLYLVQESDTLGKDSELACTLAQGKPVIAYVPVPDDGFVDQLLEKIRPASPGVSDAQLLLRQLQVFDSPAAWTDSTVRDWLEKPKTAIAEFAAIKDRLGLAVRNHYDKRAAMLIDKHPLGIQVNLVTGVANGVLVVRSELECAELIRRIMTATLEFTVEEATLDGKCYVLLRERITRCIFRVMTGDQQLTNAFWNFYLRPSA